MQTENPLEGEKKKEGEAEGEEYRKLCMERERALGRYETWFFDAKYSIISSGCLGIAAFVFFHYFAGFAESRGISFNQCIVVFGRLRCPYSSPQKYETEDCDAR